MTIDRVFHNPLLSQNVIELQVAKLVFLTKKTIFTMEINHYLNHDYV